jgi:hypothetical protein
MMNDVLYFDDVIKPQLRPDEDDMMLQQGRRIQYVGPILLKGSRKRFTSPHVCTAHQNAGRCIRVQEQQ